MKKLFFVIALIATATLTISAENARAPQKKDRLCLLQKLDLTTEQQKQIDAINADYREKKKDLNYKGKSLRASRNEAINKVLTPEQQTALKETGRVKNDYYGKKINRMKMKGDMDCKMKFRFSEETQGKLSALRENHKKELEAIKRSSIDQTEQQKQIKELKLKFKNDRREIVRSEKEKYNTKN
ncbi:hypothetical protein M2132_001595 [Dysgonomonas sp. PH5-45]|uniref:hypothetical protein n=1 Tax=unclassified Dysgonomonas TaxID=2630389 RepID=UPI0024772BBE|nr:MULTISPECIES: hypothetical protein [unclassified Dysgonomonas]MDH6355257.1 hypothetical protein [Dysgonomonas sp. PH5-45]MDH6388121.1 hypothetical protein [Dysgonomonas sp. PH5-37]